MKGIDDNVNTGYSTKVGKKFVIWKEGLNYS